jgi:subtilase family serine protease
MLPLTASFLSLPATAQAAGGTTPLAGSKPAWATPSADRGATPAGAQLDLRVYLAGRDPQGLAAYARSVSDPQNSAHGRYLTPAQVQAAYGPSASQVSSVESWLTASGLRVASATDHYIEVRGTVSAAGAAFGTSFRQYAVGKTTQRAPSSDAKVPASVGAAVLGVVGLSSVSTSDKPNIVSDATTAATTTAAASTSKTAPASTTASSNGSVPYLTALPCSAYHGQLTATDLPSAYGSSVPWAVCGYTPNQVRSAYGVTSTGLTGKGVTVAVVDAYGLPTMLADANKYSVLHGAKAFRPGQYQQIVTPSLWTEQSLCGDWSGEQALDVESVHGLAPDANVLYVGANSCFDTTGGGFAPNGGLLDSLSLIVDHHLADMVSNSWGELMHFLNPDGTVGNIDPALIAAYEQVFEQGAIEGIGFYFSSGDCGSDNPATSCGAAEGSARAQLDYPTSDAWVTSVGGTSIAIGKSGNYKWETGWQTATTTLNTARTAWTTLPGSYLYGGGGGTSEDFAQPWYQRGVVPRSLSTHLLSGASTSPKRVGPDISAYGDPSTGFLEGYTQTLPDGSTGYAELRIGGTSLSCPTLVGIQADAQQAQHGLPIGFANPEIYLRSLFGLFRDVTDHPLGPDTTLAVVRNGETNPALRTMGQDDLVHAVRGFDNSTGVGSPTSAYLRSFFW